VCGLLRVRRAARTRRSSLTIPITVLSEELYKAMLFRSDHDCREQRKRLARRKVRKSTGYCQVLSPFTCKHMPRMFANKERTNNEVANGRTGEWEDESGRRECRRSLAFDVEASQIDLHSRSTEHESFGKSRYTRLSALCAAYGNWLNVA
jgi:hypothetical protein